MYRERRCTDQFTPTDAVHEGTVVSDVASSERRGSFQLLAFQHRGNDFDFENRSRRRNGFSCNGARAARR